MVRAPKQHKEAAAIMLHVAAERDHRLLREFAASGTSVACANTFLNPVGEFNAGRTCSEAFTGNHKSSQLTCYQLLLHQANHANSPSSSSCCHAHPAVLLMHNQRALPMPVLELSQFGQATLLLGATAASSNVALCQCANVA
jgi:hypothetical protein